MEKYEFTSCNECVHYDIGRLSETCRSCKHCYGSKFEKKLEWYEDESNYPVLMVKEQIEFIIANNRSDFEFFIRYDYRLAKSTDAEKIYFDKD